MLLLRILVKDSSGLFSSVERASSSWLLGTVEDDKCASYYYHNRIPHTTVAICPKNLGLGLTNSAFE